MCGLVGIVGGNDVAAEIYDALTMLQHRGQDAAGIMTCSRGKFLQRKGTGLWETSRGIQVINVLICHRKFEKF